METIFAMAAVATLFWLLGVFQGYGWGIKDTERRWSDAVARADAYRRDNDPAARARHGGL